MGCPILLSSHGLTMHQMEFQSRYWSTDHELLRSPVHSASPCPGSGYQRQSGESLAPTKAQPSPSFRILQPSFGQRGCIGVTAPNAGGCCVPDRTGHSAPHTPCTPNRKGHTHTCGPAVSPAEWRTHTDRQTDTPVAPLLHSGAVQSLRLLFHAGFISAWCHSQHTQSSTRTSSHLPLKNPPEPSRGALMAQQKVTTEPAQEPQCHTVSKGGSRGSTGSASQSEQTIQTEAAKMSNLLGVLGLSDYFCRF